MMITSGLNILIIEDNPADIRLVQEMLADTIEEGLKLVAANGLKQGLEVLAAGNIDITLLDLGLPDSQGLDTLARLREAAPDVPIIILTGLDDEETAEAAARELAQGYLVKGQLDGSTLVRSIHYAIEHNRTISALRSSKGRYRMLFDASLDGLVQVGLDGEVIDINLKMVEISGYSHEELVGKKISSLTKIFTEDSLARIVTNFSKRLVGEKVEPYEVEVICRSGESVFLEVNAVSLKDSDGDIIGELAILHDITQRKRSERELREAENRYRTLVEKIPAITYITSLAEPGKMLYVSPQVNAYGITPEQFIKHPENWYRKIQPKSRELVLEELQRSRTNNEPYSLEYKLVTGKGQVAWMLDEAVPVADEHGEPFIMQGIIIDITERKAAEEQITVQRQELEISNRELSALYQVSTAISGTIDLNEMLTHTMQTITNLELFEFEQKAGIFIVEGDNMVLAAHSGHDDAFLKLHEDFHVGQCLCGIAADNGDLLVSNNCNNDERHTISYEGMEPHGHIILPLKVLDSVVGVLYLYVEPDSPVSKRKLNLLSSIGQLLGVAIENSRLYEETKSLSLHDPLTGLANRNLMNFELDKNFARARRNGSPISLVMLDLDYFKAFNDSFGHAAGDRLLQDISTVITSTIREIDVAVRYGGEEFLVVLPDTDREAASEVAERIRTFVADAAFCYSEEQPPEHITISLGVATLDDSTRDVDELIGQADDALYQAKRRGRNRVEVWRRS